VRCDPGYLGYREQDASGSRAIIAASLGTTIKQKLCTGMRLRIGNQKTTPKGDRVQFLTKQEEKEGHWNFSLRTLEDPIFAAAKSSLGSHQPRIPTIPGNMVVVA
jgi:hypothetical protein